ncbi:MAG: hypothetical protein AB8H86_01180 [Polyangiales bacterium]
MSNERRHLRFLITSALLVGPALGCGSAETDTQTVPIEQQPTGNPVGPLDETGQPSGEAVEAGEVEATGQPSGEAAELDEVEATGQAIAAPTDQHPVGSVAAEHPPVGNPAAPRPEPAAVMEPIPPPPTGNPVGPEPEPRMVQPRMVPEQDMRPRERRPYVNNRRDRTREPRRRPTSE